MLPNMGLIDHHSTLMGISVVGSASIFWLGYHLKKIISFQREWKAIRLGIETALSESEKIDLESLERIDNIFKNYPDYFPDWMEFRETLVEVPDLQNSTIYFSTKPIGYFLNKEDILDKKVLQSVSRQVPGLITSLGLALTFWFIVQGLSSIKNVDGNIELGGLIENLGSKFSSSITALLASLILSVWQYFADHLCAQRVSNVLAIIDEKFRTRTPQHLLTSMDERLDTLNKTMQPFGTSLANLVSEGVTQGMKVSTGELLMAINALKQEKKEGQENSLKGILEEFKKTLSSNTQNEFQELQKTITSLSASLSSSASQTSRLAQDFGEVITGLKESASVQKSSVSESVNVLSSQVAVLVAQLNEATTKQMNTVENISASLASSTNESMQSQKIAINQALENLTSKVEGLVGTLNAAGIRQAQSLEGITSSLVSKTKEVNSDLIASFEKSISKQQEVARDFASANQALKSSLIDLQAGAQAVRSILTDSERSAKSIISQVDTNLKTAQTLSGSVHISNEIFSRVQRHQEQAMSEMQRYHQMFKDAEQSCTKVLSVLDQNLRQYTNVTSEHLSKVLKQYDEQLGNASKVFTATVRDLEETLSEAIAKRNTQDQKRVA